jgi:chorismate synthase
MKVSSGLSGGMGDGYRLVCVYVYKALTSVLHDQQVNFKHFAKVEWCGQCCEP